MKFWLILSLLFCFVLVGCHSGFLSGGSGTGGSPKTPSDQMWQAVKKSNWMITISILGIAGGTFALLNGSKIGFPAIVSSCVALFMSLAVARYAGWMAVCGLIGSIAACVVSILVKKKALVEIVKGIQKLKDGDQDVVDGENVDSNGVASIGKDEFNKILASVQSKFTQKLVQQIKSSLKLKGEIT